MSDPKPVIKDSATNAATKNTRKSGRSNSPSAMSTTALAKHFDLPAKTLFTFLTERSWIDRINNHWRLTGKGEFEGGEYIQSKKYGEYIGWPSDIVDHNIFQELLDIPMTVNALGSRYNIGSHRFNALLAELGWQRRFHKGWTITPSGKKQGGIEKEDNDSGVPYTVWSRNVLNNLELQQLLLQISPDAVLEQSAGGKPTKAPKDAPQKSLDFAQTTPLPSLARDGHPVKSKEQHAVCNWLYLMNVVHACDWPLAETELACCDFYLPAAHLHMECWLEKEDAKSMSQKLARIEHYKKQQLAYIDLNSEQLNALDSVLPKMLLKYGITVY